MAEILLTRIDNRLIHGQVATQWVRELGANQVYVVNDETAKDELRKSLMNMAAPSGAKVIYLTVDELPEALKNAADDDRIFMLVENPADALRIVEEGVPLKEINVGNMHMCEGKRQVGQTVAIDDKDADVFKALQDKGSTLTIQRIPNAVKEDASQLTK